VESLRKDFPTLDQDVHGHRLAYLDNAATAHKPKVVLDAMQHFYEADNSNVHRGVHELSQRATESYEGAREISRKFVNAKSLKEIVFVRGTTEAINLVAATHVRSNLQEGDEILISVMEHHSNIVPWQLLSEATGAKIKVAPITDEGVLDMEAYEELLGPRTKFVSITHISNSLGTINPVGEIVKLAHDHDATIMLDGAQAAPHLQIDVQDIGCDFYAFSSHKAYGPTGIGVLFGKEELLDAMPPYQGGGDMISSVTFEKTTWNTLPYKFEAGTPNIASTIGMGAALNYLTKVGLDNIARHEQSLLERATDGVEKIEGTRIIGRSPRKASVLSFVLDGIHPHDIGTILDRQGIAVRTGHHCAQPVMDRFGVPATARASFGFYNTLEEADRLIDGLHKCIEVFN